MPQKIKFILKFLDTKTQNQNQISFLESPKKGLNEVRVLYLWVT